MKIKIAFSFAWWWYFYQAGLMLACRATGIKPDEEKLLKVMLKALRTRVISE